MSAVSSKALVEATKDTEMTLRELEDSTDDTLITDLPVKIQRFIHLYTAGQYTLQHLAQLLDVHPGTLSNWLKREDVRSIIISMQDDTHDVVSNQLKAMTLKAAEKMSKLMDSPIDGVALQAARDVLDRAGHKPKQEIKIDKTVTTFEQRLSSLIDATVIDAEVVD